MVRVIEGELLDRNAGASSYDAARRWLLENATHGGADTAEQYTRRAHLLIGAYLDTANLNGPQGAVRAGLDLYA